MHGGSIHVRGDAGNLVGSAYRGSERGMTGGTILVAGNVGDECGHTMRRGLIAIGGSCGDFVGINMIAGSVLVFGDCGARAGGGHAPRNDRAVGPAGTAAVAHVPPGLPPRPIVLGLLLAEIRRLGLPVAAELSRQDYWLYHGDSLTIGRGEIWVRAA